MFIMLAVYINYRCCSKLLGRGVFKATQVDPVYFLPGRGITNPERAYTAILAKIVFISPGIK